MLSSAVGTQNILSLKKSNHLPFEADIGKTNTHEQKTMKKKAKKQEREYNPFYDIVRTGARSVVIPE